MDTKRIIEPRSDAEILDGIRSGDRQAEADLLTRYRRAVVLMLRRRADPVLAEDLAHDSLVEVLKILRTQVLEQPDKLPGFIHAVACNFARNATRKRIRQRTDSDTEGLEAMPDASRDPALIAMRASLAAAVRKLLAELPIERDRQILIRFYLDDCTKSEVCRELGLSEPHFDRVVHRARQRLRSVIEGEGGSLEYGDLLVLLIALSCLGGAPESASSGWHGHAPSQARLQVCFESA